MSQLDQLATALSFLCRKLNGNHRLILSDYKIRQIGWCYAKLRHQHGSSCGTSNRVAHHFALHQKCRLLCLAMNRQIAWHLKGDLLTILIRFG